MAQPSKIRKRTPSEQLPRRLVSFGSLYDQNASSRGKAAVENGVSASNEPQDGAISFLTQAKEKAWVHVVKATPGGERNTRNAYFRAMQNIEVTARSAYADQPNAGRKFQETMILDGCLFLHIAILVLGGSAILGYPSDDPLFGKNIQEEYMERWIQSMLFVGNQIPFVVLKELMKQPFFRNVIGKMKLKRPSGLFKTALYELLLVGSNRGMNRQELPHDLIHSLHLLVLSATQEAHDFGNNGRVVDCEKLEIPSAKELSEMGIKIKKKDGVGSARIRFETSWFSSTLYLPKFKVGETRKLILESLIDYEKAQDKQEVTSYVKFMSELVREPVDAKILHDQGVIDADLRQRKEFPEILGKLSENSEVVPSGNILDVRLQINEHSPHKWPKWVKFIPMGVILSIVQITVAILTYREDQNKCACLYQSPPPH